ncbi:MAG: hypothetical protein LWY06_05655 [Firmicutes bacterium]|nr:hypothetical protein [Bacillota bacterium]
MCNLLYLSTTGDLVPSQCNHSGFLFFEKITREDYPRIGEVLLYDNLWFVSNKQGGCSCGFRNTHNDISDFGFYEPLDWAKEEEENIIATKLLYQVIRGLLDSGHGVDILEDWDELPPEEFSEMEVDLNEVREEQLVFYVNSHYVFKAGS